MKLMTFKVEADGDSSATVEAGNENVIAMRVSVNERRSCTRWRCRR